MSSSPAISIDRVDKTYQLHKKSIGRLLHAFGIDRYLSRLAGEFQEFHALRNVNLEMERGERVGLIGSNGAGKSTLLKLIVGNLRPTRGHVTVNGDVQALMTAGAGFHPEYTGRENVLASMTARGLDSTAARRALEEITEFTELQKFIDQPFRTYSAGMQARLTFATATSLNPEILIIDEMLGAGDAYFLAKSAERVDHLVTQSGATVILVSHDMAAIQRFCHRVLWLDSGEIRDEGPTFEVSRRYQKWTRDRNEARLIEAGRRPDAEELSDSEHVWSGAAGMRIDNVDFLGGDGDSRRTFDADQPIQVVVSARATLEGELPLQVAVVVYRPDGVCQSQFVSELYSSRWSLNEIRDFQLHIPSPRYGNGRYLVSIGLYRSFAQHADPDFYEAHDREYEFEVQGNPWYHVGACRPDGEWTMNIATAKATSSPKPAKESPDSLHDD